jgi:hypothetical protein
MRKILVCAIFALTPCFSQEAPSLPAWLASYPGASPEVNSRAFLVQSTYTTPAQPEDIVEHYRKLFETASLPFLPNYDGMGTAIRASAPECDLLIQIRTRSKGTFVSVDCAAKTLPAPASAAPPDVKVMSGGRQSPQSPRATTYAPPQIPADWMAEHQRKVAEMGIHREHHDAPAPPLVWPSWLTHVRGEALRPVAGVDQSKNGMLKAQYTTNVPMTEIYDFYRELLKSHEYPTRSHLSTGHTSTGIQQNADGSVEGTNYPDGAPGASSEIKINFGRSVLNGPITVTLRFTTREYIAKRGY